MIIFPTVAGVRSLNVGKAIERWLSRTLAGSSPVVCLGPKNQHHARTGDIDHGYAYSYVGSYVCSCVGSYACSYVGGYVYSRVGSYASSVGS